MKAVSRSPKKMLERAEELKERATAELEPGALVDFLVPTNKEATQ
jgi:hypothetical protein